MKIDETQTGLNGVIELELAFVVKLLYETLSGQAITDDELQALSNIANDLPYVDADDFRY